MSWRVYAELSIFELVSTDVFTIVADPTRRRILSELVGRERSVGELVGSLGLSQPTVSKHLKVLRDHGLVAVREEGQHRYYSLEASPLEELEDWLIPFLSADFDPTRIDPDASQDTAVFAAWSGAEVGQKVGRAVAERSYRARTVIKDAQDQVSRGIRRLKGK